MINKELIKQEAGSSHCIIEISRQLADALIDCRNELAEIRGWKDGYVLNASDALACYDTFNVAMTAINEVLK